MNRNDMRSVVFLIISLIALYYLLDDFLGKKKISGWVDELVGGFGGIAAPEKVQKTDTKDTSTGGTTAPATEPAGATVAAANKVLLQSQQETGNLATGTVRTTKPATTKSGSKGFNLNDLIPHFGLPSIPLGLPAIVAGETFALPYQLSHAFR